MGYRPLSQAVPGFEETLTRHGIHLNRTPTEILQVNVGKLCNQACYHCHVEAGPRRTEIMEPKTAERVIELMKASPGIHTVDLTGGAPEMNSSFQDLVRAARGLGKKVIDRCNLTIFFEPGHQNTPKFLADHQVVVIASLPCYSEANVNKQRGKGVFGKSIEALLMLNRLGYGKPGSGLELNLVYNPVGNFLPPPQAKLEADYHERLRVDFGIVFNHLYTITNMPIKRYLGDLERSGKLDEYLELLLNHFNPAAANGVMCRNLVSVGWDGQVYDCDFNQMLEMPLGGKRKTIWDFETLDGMAGQEIAFAQHCYGCTAGAGSSCAGALNKN